MTTKCDRTGKLFLKEFGYTWDEIKKATTRNQTKNTKMNKTININLGQFILHIDEDPIVRLNAIYEAIKTFFCPIQMVTRRL